MAMKIDLNADLGEGMEHDEALLRFVTSCSVACGGHAGDAVSMRRTLKLAKVAGVRVGAHPSYPDREGFGRRSLDIDQAKLEASLTDQITALRRIADTEEYTLTHLKAHGALYNDATGDEVKAELLVRLIENLLPGASLLGPPGSALERASHGRLAFLAEGFIDRGYRQDGTLVPRTERGAFVSEPDAQLSQALALATEKPLEADGGMLRLKAATLCIHGDGPGADQVAQRLRAGLAQSGVSVEPYAC
ncbi:5-oxoprolinase subunit PxpA [Parvularcula maris]|uniref:5-oxoprolinase subunit PxpA n=1 Tax=Parvularcula maris TaxID=2965077 RepID=A0A9X2LAV8_9PROT|nr:5-oxoprolinase subunit PxpA [Parvularcula maris]MCQ8186338.1 5-oxoprolinase subunit PxpA [Parvularcula maris]